MLLSPGKAFQFTSHSLKLSSWFLLLNVDVMEGKKNLEENKRKSGKMERLLVKSEGGGMTNSRNRHS